MSLRKNPETGLFLDFAVMGQYPLNRLNKTEYVSGVVLLSPEVIYASPG